MVEYAFLLHNRLVLMCLIANYNSIPGHAVEIIEADYNDYAGSGRLLLIRVDRYEMWRTLDLSKNILYSGNLDSTCECFKTTLDNYGYGGYCDSETSFSPQTLTIRDYKEKVFPSGLFQLQIFSHLQNCQISGLGIVDFSASMLIGADSLQRLNLSRNALKELPSKSFADAAGLIEIDLSHNQIAKMPPDVFVVESALTDLPVKARLNLKTIRLNNNNLTFIDPSWFRYLINLEKITLNDNHLTEIDVDSAFHYNPSLQSIDLSNNKFSNIISNGFETKLEFFDISNNPKSNGTQSIEVNAKTVNISNTNSRKCNIPLSAILSYAEHNRINSVTVEEASNTNLLEVYLSHNEIDTADFLKELWNLEIIDLSHNALVQLDSNIFENLLNLSSLNISFNKFTTIDLAFIGRAMNLTHLDISNNHLSGRFYLNFVAKSLSTLNIANNNYSSVQQNLKKHAPNLTLIDLNGNHFDCNDLTSTILFLNFDQIRTVTPLEDESKSIIKDNVKGIRCYARSDSDMFNNHLSQNSSQQSYFEMKNDMNKSFDNKLAQLESRLIEILRNVTASNSKIQNNVV